MVWASRGGWEESDELHFEHGTPEGRQLESAGYGVQERGQGWRLHVKFNSGRKPSPGWTRRTYVQRAREDWLKALGSTNIQEASGGWGGRRSSW